MLTRKLGRKKPHREHMMRNLAASVILYESVETTEAKAKEAKRVVEKSISLAKKNTLAARRALESLYFDSNVAKKLMEVLAARYTDRPSGYTRIVRTGIRHGDAADRAIISLIPEVKSEEPITTKGSEAKSEVAQEEKDNANKA